MEDEMVDRSRFDLSYFRTMRKSSVLGLLALSTSLLFSCNGGSDAPEGQPAPAGPAATTPAPAPDAWAERDRWQQPQQLIEMMGGTLLNITVVDLFADDGYFTVKLLDAGADVIAVVNEPAKAERLEALKKERGIPDDRLRIRLVPVGDPGLAPEEADMALITHRYRSIGDKEGYFKLLRRGLRYPKLLFMLEWPQKTTAMGPPASERLAPEYVMESLGNVGFTDVSFNAAVIPEQVIYVAHDPMDDMSGDGSEVQL
ncbi:MAG TPA: hypothetical protein PLN54_08530 [Flavobacteriales bacterium]|nr:hypothetical protein [Flavobacteriales bacterium]